MHVLCASLRPPGGRHRRLTRLLHQSQNPNLIPARCRHHNMRRKTTPSSAHPKKRRRTNSTPPLHQWAHAEWFQSALDDPFFTHSEFTHVITSALSLPHLLARPPTRLQLSRLRAAMCNAFPGGFATPRRFSSAFLAAEIEELTMYRADARRIIRGQQLLPATDPTTADPLPPRWWSRYRCPPPLPLQRGTHVLVRTSHPPPHFSPTSSPEKSLRTTSSSTASTTYIRNAVFLSLSPNSHNCVRFSDEPTEITVSDLDVMNTVSPPGPELVNLSPFSRLPNLDRMSPASARFSFSSSPLPDVDFSRVDAPSNLVHLYASPRPVIISPKRPVEIKSRTANRVECEVDVQQIAETMRLLDRKQELLLALKTVNDLVTLRVSDNVDPYDSAQAQYKQLLHQIQNVNTELRLLMQSERTANSHQTLATALSGPPIPQPKFDETPDKKQDEGKDCRRTATHSPVHTTEYTTTVERGLASSTPPPLPPAHLAKNVDFRNATGAALLAKALTQASFAKLDPENKLKTAPPATRADVMECVSACVAVLVRARATKEFNSIEELIDGIRVRYPANTEAIEAIHEAARSFDCASSDSL